MSRKPQNEAFPAHLVPAGRPTPPTSRRCRRSTSATPARSATSGGTSSKACNEERRAASTATATAARPGRAPLGAAATATAISLGALTGDYGAAERDIRDKLQAQARTLPASSCRRPPRCAPRRIQHPRADADPRLSRDGPSRRRPRSARPRRAQGAPGAEARDLRLHRRRSRPPDLHRPRARPRDGDDARRSCSILRRTYCRQIGVEFMHITSPAQKAWIQERIEGEEKDISFTAGRARTRSSTS